MVRQAGPGEEPFWSVPAGQLEPGELVTEARRSRGQGRDGDHRPRSAARRVHGAGGRAARGLVRHRLDLRRRRLGGRRSRWPIQTVSCSSRPGSPSKRRAGAVDLISWHPLTARYLRGYARARGRSGCAACIPTAERSGSSGSRADRSRRASRAAHLQSRRDRTGVADRLHQRPGRASTPDGQLAGEDHFTQAEQAFRNLATARRGGRWQRWRAS